MKNNQLKRAVPHIKKAQILIKEWIKKEYVDLRRMETTYEGIGEYETPEEYIAVKGITDKKVIKDLMYFERDLCDVEHLSIAVGRCIRSLEKDDCPNPLDEEVWSEFTINKDRNNGK